jgi:hypothetical protein
MTRLFAPFGFDLPAPGSRLRDRETSAPGVSPGRENGTSRAQGAALRRTVKVPALR